MKFQAFLLCVFIMAPNVLGEDPPHPLFEFSKPVWETPLRNACDVREILVLPDPSQVVLHMREHDAEGQRVDRVMLVNSKSCETIRVLDEQQGAWID